MTMTRTSHVDFFTRSMLFMIAMFCRQLPRDYDVRIDREAFLQSFSFSSDGSRVNPAPWPLGPDGAVHQVPDPGSPRELARQAYLKAYYEHVAPGIPCAPNTYPGFAGTPGRGKSRPRSRITLSNRLTQWPQSSTFDVARRDRLPRRSQVLVSRTSIYMSERKVDT